MLIPLFYWSPSWNSRPSKNLTMYVLTEFSANISWSITRQLDFSHSTWNTQCCKRKLPDVFLLMSRTQYKCLVLCPMDLLCSGGKLRKIRILLRVKNHVLNAGLGNDTSKTRVFYVVFYTQDIYHSSILIY